jgi:putative ABC transport system permease protein
MTAIALPRSSGTAVHGRAERDGGSWRVATRLARREVRRRWGRTLLVMILVAVPVVGMTVVTTLVRTTKSSAAHDFEREFGQANLAAVGTVSTPAGGWPAGTRVVHGRAIDSMGLVSGRTARLAKVTDLDLHSPVLRGAALLRTGRFPHAQGEALISPKLARAFGVHVGDTLRLTEPAWTERIVGIGVTATDWNDGFLAVRGNELSDRASTFSSEPVQRLTVVQLPGHPTDAQLRGYGPAYFSAATTRGSAERAVDWTLVGGMIALAIVGVVISGAFAVGARRQLVTLGQLSANGAPESLLRGTLALQGAWCGVLGTLVGLGAGAVTLSLMHGQFNDWAHRDIGRFAWSARDLVAIGVTGIAAATVAAFVPARTAARVPVLSALAGRRPLGALPRWIVPVGVVLFASGVFVLTLVGFASRDGGGDGLAFAAVVGGLLVLGGACCVSPVVVASLAHLGGRLRRAGRVAVRSLVRSRARSAAVVMALAAINAGAVAIATAFDSGTQKVGAAAPLMPDNALIITRHAALPIPALSKLPPDQLPDAKAELASGPANFLPVPASVERTLHTILPNARLSARRAVLGVALRRGSGGDRALVPGDADVMIVADPAVVQIVGLSHADAATLRHAGVLALPFGRPTATSVPLTIGTGASAHTLTVPYAKDHLRATAGTSFLITAHKAHELGLPIVDAGLIAANPLKFDEAQRASIDALGSSMTVAPTGSSSRPIEVLWSGPRDHGLSPSAVRRIMLAIVVAIALLVLAMSLALSAAETRDERDVLVALGAPPRTMRAVAAWKAALLSWAGAAVAIPTGFIPVAFVYLAVARADERANLVFPWSTALILLVAAPLIAALVAAIGSGIAQRIRPTKMSTFALD